MGFWEIPPDSKIDILKEDKHLSHILSAVADRETFIENASAGNFVLFGEKEGLLTIVFTLPFKVYLSVCALLFNCFKPPQG